MLRWLFKWTFRVGLVLTAVLGLFFLLRNVVARTIVEHRIGRWTGLETLVGRAELQLTQPRLVLRDVRLKNPPGTATRPFLEAPVVVVDYDLQALLFRQVRLHRVRIEATEMNLMRRDQGLSTQAVLEPALAAAQTNGGFGPLQFVGLDRLDFALARYSYLDYYQMQLSREHNLGITNAAVVNIASFQSLQRALQKISADKGLQWPPSDVRPGARTR